MIIFKYNKINDLFTIINTIRFKKFLNKNKIFYSLSILPAYKKLDHNELINVLKNKIEKYNHIYNDSEYIVYLSKFGAFGSYKMPNKVYVNIQRDPDKIIKTILHEIIHLQVEEDTIERGLNWKQREKLVKAIFDHYNIT